MEKPSSDLEFKCPICLLIMKDPCLPVTCKCGTNFCKTCIDPIYETNKRCPICNESFSSIAPNVALKRTIDGKQVYCTYKRDGCRWRGELRRLHAHLVDASTPIANNCQYYPEPCMLCNVPIRRKCMFDHRNFECPKRTYYCDYCKYSSDYTDVIENHIPNCDFAPVSCSNVGCKAQMLRKDLSEHISVCPETVVWCAFASVGCDVFVPRKELHSHYERKMPFHMCLVAKHGREEREELRVKVDHLESENEKLSDIIISGLKDEVKSLREDIKTLKQNNDERLCEVEQKCTKSRDDCTSMINRQVKNQVAHHIKEVKREMKQGSTSHATAHQTQQSSDSLTQVNTSLPGCMKEGETSSFRHLKESCDSLSRNTSLEEVHRSIGMLQDETTAIKDKVAANQLNFEDLLQDQFITLTSAVGLLPVTVLLRDFSMWRVKGECASPPFYLDGYKLCLSAFVNEEPAPNIHGYFSLYVHLMKGENDSTLSWPFQRTVTLELLHPDDSKNEKVNLCFDSTLDKKCTGGVVGQERGEGWGYISQLVLHGFLMGEREILKIRVC